MTVTIHSVDAGRLHVVVGVICYVVDGMERFWMDFFHTHTHKVDVHLWTSVS